MRESVQESEHLMRRFYSVDGRAGYAPRAWCVVRYASGALGSGTRSAQCVCEPALRALQVMRARCARDACVHVRLGVSRALHATFNYWLQAGWRAKLAGAGGSTVAPRAGCGTAGAQARFVVRSV